MLLLTLLTALLVFAAPARAQEGDVVIRRVMANPTAAPDERGEWIELANTGARDRQLAGWRLRSGRDEEHVITRPLVVPAHASVIVGRSTDRARNGGVAVTMAYTGITLGNGADWIALADAHGATVDSVAWTSAPAGVAIERAPSAAAPPPAPARDTAASRELVVRMLDVGQGDAILIENGGSTVLVDGGPNPAVLGRHLEALGLEGRTIDAVVLTHAHADHYQGLRELFATRRRITVRYFWENQDPSANATLARLRDSVGARVARGTLVYRDTDDPCANGAATCTVTLKGGAKLHILRPDPRGATANDRSPALKLVGPDSASFTMWLAGDAERDAIAWFERMYSRAPGMGVDVLKANHHGSCNGVTRRYLELTQPRLVVASLAAINDYGHMHAQAKAAFAAAGVPWHRTDQNGTIVLRSPGVPGGGYSVAVERGGTNLAGPSDRRSRGCE